MAIAAFLCALLVLPALAAAQSPETVSEVRRYVDLLAVYAAEHRRFVESVAIGGGLLGTVAVAVIGFFGWRTRQDVTREVRERVQEIRADAERRAQKAADDAVAEFREKVLIAARADVERELAALRTELAEARRRSAEEAAMAFAAARRSTAETPAAPSPGPVTAATAKPRILWVDDVPDNNAFPARVLSSAGAEIVTALSTEQALAARGAFDLVISDLGRGAQRDAGVETVRALRQAGYKAPIIIFASTRATDQFGSRALEAGADRVTSGYEALFDATRELIGLPR